MEWNGLGRLLFISAIDPIKQDDSFDSVSEVRLDDAKVKAKVKGRI